MGPKKGKKNGKRKFLGAEKRLRSKTVFEARNLPGRHAYFGGGGGKKKKFEGGENLGKRARDTGEKGERRGLLGEKREKGIQKWVE